MYVEEVRRVRPRGPNVHVVKPHHHRSCSPALKILIACVGSFLVIGGIIGLIVFFVLPKKQQDPVRVIGPTPAPVPGNENPCKEQGICQWKPFSQCFWTGTGGTIECLCPQGFWEEDGKCRTQDSTPDESHPCRQIGVCSWKPHSLCYQNTNDNGHTCRCAPGYEEENGFCHPLVTATTAPPPTNVCLDPLICAAKPNSLCFLKDISGEFKCLCAPGFEPVGDICLASTHCDFQVCLHGGVCVNDNLRTRCDCQHGYSGENCQIASACASYPCRNGMCSEDHGTYKCKCMKGWIGKNCDQKESACTIHPCYNGRCFELESGFECFCDAGWEGKYCEIESNNCGRCHPDNTLECIESATSFYCRCDPGWQGQYCEQEIDECLSATCDPEHSTCIDHFLGFTCKCEQGWSGVLCDNEIDDCIDALCDFEHSTCFDEGTSYRCDCNDGWEGNFCDMNVNDCIDSDCSPSNSYCEDGDNDYTCVCYSGYTGTLCETTICAVTGVTYTDSSTVCLANNNDIILTVAAGDALACQAACDSETAFVCCSAEYQTSDGTCNLSPQNKLSVPIADVVPCNPATYEYFEVDSCKSCPGVP